MTLATLKEHGQSIAVEKVEINLRQKLPKMPNLALISDEALMSMEYLKGGPFDGLSLSFASNVVMGAGG